MAKGKDPEETVKEFKKCVNMTVKELEKWLKTKESKEVGPAFAVLLCGLFPGSWGWPGHVN